MKRFKTSVVASFFKAIGHSETPGSTAVTVLAKDESGMVREAKGTTVPTDTEAGFAKGCKFVKTNGGVATTIYYNEGSSSSCDFNAVESSASTITAIVAGYGVLGSATEGSATIELGLAVRNETGVTITKGSLVRVAGIGTGNVPLVVLADADGGTGTQAQYVMAADLATATNGNAYKVALVTGINTSAVTSAGDPLYLSNTAGAFTNTPPSGDIQCVQRVGIVIVKDAAVGTALFFPGAAEKFGTNEIQDGAISPTKIAASVALTSTADGLTTGSMNGNNSHAIVTSASATNWITLPASSTQLLGKTYTIWVGANGFELVTPASSNATINGTDSDGTNQVDIPANSLTRVTLVNTNTWLLENIGSTGTVAAAIIPDND